MAVTITYFVHGATKDNEEGRYTGRYDIELSELGRKQSYDLRELVKDQHFDMIYCSDRKRAIETAKIVWGDAGIPIKPTNLLREVDLGSCDGWPTAAADPQMVKHIRDPWPGGGRYLDVERDVRLLFSDIRRQHRGQHLAFVGHRAPQLAIDVILKGKTWEQAIAEDWRHTKKWQPGWAYELP